MRHPNKKRIAVITSSRADFGHLFWPLKELEARPEVDLLLIAMGPHLSSEFGHTVDAIEEAGFVVDYKLECLLSSDSDVGMAKTIGIATQSLADVLGRERPDLLLVIADRYEMLAPASVALALRIPIVHIEGGEASEGAIDHAVRNALTMMSHIHLTPTELSRRRVIAMGEESWRVHCTGAPSLDHLNRSALLDRASLETELGHEIFDGTILVGYHPVTLEKETVQGVGELLAALEQVRRPLIFCFPNADAGSRRIIKEVEGFRARRWPRDVDREVGREVGHEVGHEVDHKVGHEVGREVGRREAPSIRIHVNLPPIPYWSLLRHVDMLVGNSSSGIMESPSVGIPAINIGDRQKGRERAENIIDVQPEAGAIVQAIERASTEAFRSRASNAVNPYGDGNASVEIARILAELPIDATFNATLLRKPALQLPD